MDGDLISRSALLEILEKEHGDIRQIYCSLIDYVDKAICKGELGTYARVKRMVEEAPAVDAVEVARCEKCVHFDIIDGTPYCHYWSRNTEENGFCHNGL